VVVTEDLARALKEGWIAGAGIDVFDREPPLDLSEPLLAAPNTIVTPHTAFATEESMDERLRIVFDNLRAYLAGKPVNLV
jgi:D-3-phosphoglycerate dehydrogenase